MMQELAEQHWAWVAGLLQAGRRIIISIEEARYLYITAMVHGHKHGYDDGYRAGREDALREKPVAEEKVYWVRDPQGEFRLVRGE